jgi:hypothetical protein
MTWYEITGLIVAWVLCLYLRGQFYESMRDYFYKDSWRTKRKK